MREHVRGGFVTPLRVTRRAITFLCVRARVNLPWLDDESSHVRFDRDLRDTETRSAKCSPDTFAKEESSQSWRLATPRVAPERREDDNARCYRGAEITRCSFPRAQRVSHFVTRGSFS